jgi:hypothetical protein
MKPKSIQPTVRAHVVVKGPGADMIKSDRPITSKEVGKLMASPEVVESAVDTLSQLGFGIVGRSPLQVTVEAPRDRFEEVFGSSLVPLKSGGSAAKPARAGDKHFWKWRSPPKVPESLHELVADVVLPQPVQPHGGKRFGV